MTEPVARDAWGLDPDVAFLNHGSFGATPQRVLDVQRSLQDRMEREPMDFFLRDLVDLLEAARARVAAFVHADDAGLVFVPNATHAVNAVFGSIALEPGDELLITDHGYNACTNTLLHTAERAGARVVRARIPFPSAGPEEARGAIAAAVTDRTRWALIDHITSPTALVLPIRDIVADLRGRGVRVMVDGAHAPGMVELDVSAVGADAYTGNLHKWPAAPKGAAFLHVVPDLRGVVRPWAISHGARMDGVSVPRFRREFDWTGTHDPTAWLAAPAALDLLPTLLEGGWPAIRRRNRALALEARASLCSRLGVAPPCPDSMIGWMATIPLTPRDVRGPTAYPFRPPLGERLRWDHRVEAPIVYWPEPPTRWIRISAHLYNGVGDYARLGAALEVCLAAETSGGGSGQRG
jgi:isopenicillin-N epimerase